MKKNKTRLDYKTARIIKKEYFEGGNPYNLAIKYGYNSHYLRTYLSGQATTLFTDDKGVVWKRCTGCGIYKIREDNYYFGGKYYVSSCKYCSCIKKRNKIIIKKNTGNFDEIQKMRLKTWNKNKWKYNTRKKVLRIIGYLDGNYKIIHKN